jgi:succinylglutamate desuccinylase
VDLSDLPRELGRIVGLEPGPTLICLGGLHGNEPAGVLAIDRVLSALRQENTTLRGELVGLVGNRRALAQGDRFVDHDLNRAWRPERLARLLRSPGPQEAEDREQVELDAVLQEVIQEAPGRVFLLDLHTTSGPGSAFAILDDTLPNREIALDFPVPLVLGLEEELAGTLASYLTAQGVTVLGFEAGQHEDPGSVTRAEAAIWLAIDSCGLLEGGDRDRARAAHRLLEEETETALRIGEVRYRHPVELEAGFRMAPGFKSFQPVASGQILGQSAGGPVEAPFAGLLLMPLYQDQGQDGFFLMAEIRPVWLSISAVVRSWHLERFIHLLPGVRRDADRRDTFRVDRRWARWLAPQLFHLLGFRREGKEDGRILVVRRRAD